MSASPSAFVDGPAEAVPLAEVRYTCFIRLPFPRDGFEDPPHVRWDTTKDRALWKMIYKTSHSRDLDWEALSTRFGVSLPFLLQQAAWLTERHLDGMRKQMQKLGTGVTVSESAGLASPALEAPGHTPPAASSAMSRPVSKSSMRRLSNLHVQSEKTSSNEITAHVQVSAVERPSVSRTPSANTIVQSRAGVVHRQSPQHRYRGSNDSQRQEHKLTRPADDAAYNHDSESAIGADESTEPDTDSDEESQPINRSLAFRRPANIRKPTTMKTVDDEDEDDESSSGGFLPFATATKTSSTDPAATIREPFPPQPLPNDSANQRRTTFSLPAAAPDSSASSASSAAHHVPVSTEARTSRRPGPLSPSQQAQLAGLSPRSRRDRSDGSPSLGSSFSDLDDLSVTQSTLEEALLSAQQQQSISGSVASRVSGFRDVLKRR